ncbi:MAG TPA: hypothetical protein VLJ44_04470 [Gaiellaceae bacterium]|nr:hypothetical protein [Gaiellaceae bacterium]
MSTLSPELALVDPDLRADAIARLPPVYVNAFLEFPPLPVAAPSVRTPSFQLGAALAYLAIAIARTVAFDAVVFAGVAALVLLVSVVA